MTEHELALILRVSTRTLRRWRQDGRLPYVRIGRNLRFRECDIDALIAPNNDDGPAGEASPSNRKADDTGHAEE